MELFGFELRKKAQVANTTPTFTPLESEDGAMTVAPGGAYATYLDLDGSVRSDAEQVMKYREMYIHPEIDSAVDDIINEMIVMEPNIDPIKINLDNLNQPDNIRDVILAEFKQVLKLYNFSTASYEMAKRWYVDGRLYYHAVIDTTKPELGIQELRYIDPRKIRKIREVRRKKDPDSIATLVNNESEYFVYNERGFQTSSTNVSAAPTAITAQGLKIAKDSIIYVTSGLLDKNNKLVLSYLHKAIKPLNMLKSSEDAVVIYRISRAPERRVFYIDVGNLPKMKAEQYVRDIMTKFKNKVVYDSATGEIRDDRKFMTMLEDFWLPRREGGRGTEITTLPAGQNLGELEDVKYFQKKLFRSLNVPIGRMESESSGFNMGKAAEITRDEIKFDKFVQRLRLKFSNVFLDALKIQLILKNIVTQEDWEAIKQDIAFDYAKDNYWSELKESEILAQRANVIEILNPMIGKYYSHEYIQRKVLYLTDDEIRVMQAEIAVERKLHPDWFPELLDAQLAQKELLAPPEKPGAKR